MIATQRKKNYWEPIYDPNIKISNNINNSTLRPNELSTIKGWKKSKISLEIFEPKKYVDLTFDTIDFLGSLSHIHPKYTTFEECTFMKVSFSGTTFKNVKFKKCKFNMTTFSLSTFENCEFRDCTFSKIGISGNTTIFINTYIDASKLLVDVFLNKDKDILLNLGKTTPEYQEYRSFGTKATLARQIIHMKPVKNDLSLLIKSIKTARNFEMLTEIKGALFSFKTENFLKKIYPLITLLYFIFELIIVNFFGFLTGWGYNIGKAVLIGLSCNVFFSLIYNFFFFKESTFFANLLKAFEYWFLFGYTKYTYDTPLILFYQYSIFLNAMLGMLWFSALIPVIINKMGNYDE